MVDDIFVIEKYIIGKGNELIGVIFDFFFDMVNCVDDFISKFVGFFCIKFLMNIVKRDVFFVEVCYEFLFIFLFCFSYFF